MRYSWKQPAFAAILVISVVAVIEFISFAALSLLNREWIGYWDLETERYEIVSRATEHVPNPVREELRRLRWTQADVLHPFLGFVRQRNAESIQPDGSSHPVSAEFGFPDNVDNLFQTPATNKVVIGVFGGSVARHLTRFGAPALENELHKQQRFSGKNIVIISVTAGGYKQPQQLMALNYFLALGAHFDIVLNIDGFNEVALPQAELVPKGIFPFFPRNWFFKVADLTPDLRRALGSTSYLRDLRLASAELFSYPALRHSMTAGLLWGLLDRHLKTKISRAQLTILDEKTVSESYHTRGPHREYLSEAELYRNIAAVWQRSSLQMYRLCAGSGIEYYHFLQPNQYVQDSKRLTPEELRTAWRDNNLFRPGVVAGYPALVEAGAELRRQGVPFHDLTMLFRDVPGTVYVDDCCHFNADGNRTLAEAIAEAIGDKAASAERF